MAGTPARHCPHGDAGEQRSASAQAGGLSRGNSLGYLRLDRAPGRAGQGVKDLGLDPRACRIVCLPVDVSTRLGTRRPDELAPGRARGK